MDLSRQYGFKIFFSGIKLLFFKIASWNFQHMWNLKNFNSFCLFRQLLFSFFHQFSDWVENLRGLMKLSFKQILKVSAFYLEKQKSFIHKKSIFRLLPISKQNSFVYWPNFQWRFWKECKESLRREFGHRICKKVSR